MGKSITIFLKELKETLRDRRTLVSMVIVPLLIYPLMFIIISQVSKSQTEKSMEQNVKVGLVNADQAVPLKEDFMLDSKFSIVHFPDSLDIQNMSPGGNDSALYQLVRSESYDVILWFDELFISSLDSNQAGRVWFYYNSTSNDIVQKRVERKLEVYEEHVLDKRFKDAGIDRSFSEGLLIQKQNVATEKEIFGMLAGGFLPYLFIIIAFTGSMYPALDLAAGEKERGTIETLLTSPASRSEIILGKIMVVILAGLISALISVVGILLALNYVDFLPGQLLEAVYTIVEPQNIIMLLTMMLPLTLLFACLLLSFSIYAKSFREAQSMVTPMIVLIIFPAFFGMLPGIELNATTALVPILNVSLVTKNIMAGTLEYLFFAEAIASTITLAGMAFLFSLSWFGREDVILR